MSTWSNSAQRCVVNSCVARERVGHWIKVKVIVWLSLGRKSWVLSKIAVTTVTRHGHFDDVITIIEMRNCWVGIIANPIMDYTTR